MREGLVTRRRTCSCTLAVTLLALMPAAAHAQGQPGLAPPSATQSQTGASGRGSQSSSPYGAAVQSGGTQPASQNQNPFSGSVPSKLEPGVISLSLEDAVNRGLKQNLGALLSNADITSARGQRWEQLSQLLPRADVQPYVDVSRVNLKEFGFSVSVPGINIPSIVGPFSYLDARAYVTQTLFDWQAINRTRAATQSLKSSEHTYQDARDLVVLAVGFSYLQAIADAARIETAQAQVNTAQTLYRQASDQVQAGTAAAIDALRAQVELQTRQQQLIQAKNDFEIQKLQLARVIGLALGQPFELTDKSPYAPLEAMTPEDAVKRAMASRADYQAAAASLRAAEYSKRAAVAGYFPSLSFSADYGAGGPHPSNAAQVFDVRGTLTIPLFQGGAIHGEVLQADAQLKQARERLENVRGQIDSDVRTALLNLQSSAQQVEVARSNIDLAEQTLTQSRDRFAAGVTDTVEVVQAEEQVASAHEQYISSLYNYNYAKISLARALGLAEQGVKEFFKGK
jgi:outer membrane protein TolC